MCYVCLWLYVRSTAKVIYGREKLRKKEKPGKKIREERNEEAYGIGLHVRSTTEVIYGQEKLRRRRNQPVHFLTRYVLVWLFGCLGLYVRSTAKVIYGREKLRKKEKPGPLTNHLCFVFSFRAVAIVGGVLCSSGYFISSFMNKMEWLYLTYGIVTGTGYGLLFPATMTIVNYYVQKRRALANGIIVAGAGVGVFVLPYLYRALINEYGLRGNLMLFSGVLLHVCVSSAILRQPTQLVKEKGILTQTQENKTATYVQRTTSKSAMDEFHKRRVKYSFGKLVLQKISDFNIPSFTTVCLALMFQQGAYSATIMMLSPHIVILGYSKEEADFVVSVVGAGEIFSRIVFGWFADKHYLQTKHLFVVTVIISGLTSIIVSFFTLYPVQIMYGIVMGLFSGAYLSFMSVMVIDVVGMERLPQALGNLFFCLACTNSITPPLSGWLKDMTGFWVLSFRVFGCISVFSGLLVMLDPVITKFWCCRIKKPNTTEVKELSKMLHSRKDGDFEKLTK